MEVGRVGVKVGSGLVSLAFQKYRLDIVCSSICSMYMLKFAYVRRFRKASVVCCCEI